MKKIVSVVSMLVVASSVLAGSYSSVVGPIPSLVVPFPTVQPSSAGTWGATATTNAPGTVVAMYTNLYVCPVGGVSTGVIPPLVAGDLTDGASIVWRKVLNAPRKGIVISNVGSNLIFVSAQSNAFGGAAIPAGSQLPILDCSNMQMGLWMRCTNAVSTTTISVWEY